MVEVASYGEVHPNEEGEGEEAHDHAVDGEHVEGVVRVPTELCGFWICRPILRVDGSKLEELGKVVECRESQHGQNVTHQSALVAPLRPTKMKKPFNGETNHSVD